MKSITAEQGCYNWWIALVSSKNNIYKLPIIFNTHQ